MITGIIYIACEYLLNGWSGWALVLPVILDLVLIERVEKVGK